jgi:energy-converting hydrogenase Eha subunit B
MAFSRKCLDSGLAGCFGWLAQTAILDVRDVSANEISVKIVYLQ